MARPTNSFETLTITIAVAPQIKAYLEDLTAWGTYGASPSEAARTILNKGIEDLLAGRLPRREFKIEDGKVLKLDDDKWAAIK